MDFEMVNSGRSYPMIQKTGLRASSYNPWDNEPLDYVSEDDEDNKEAQGGITHDTGFENETGSSS